MKVILSLALILVISSCTKKYSEIDEFNHLKLSSTIFKKGVSRGISSTIKSGNKYTAKIFHISNKEWKTFTPKKTRLWKIKIDDFFYCYTTPEFASKNYYWMDVICRSGNSPKFSTRVGCNKNNPHDQGILYLYNQDGDHVYNIQLICKY